MAGRLIAFFVGVLVVAAAATAQPLSDRVPDSAIVYIAWQGAQAMPPAYSQSRLKSLLDSSNVPALFTDFLPQAMQKIGQRNPQANQVWQLVRTIGGPMWRHPSAFYFAGIDFKNPGGPAPKLGILCDAGNEADALFNQLNRLAEGQLMGAPFPVKAFRIGPIVGIAAGFPDEERAMAGKESPNRPKPISSAPKFQQAIAQVQKDPVAVVYMDVEATVAVIDDAIRANQDPNSVAEWNKAREATGLNDVQRAILTGGFDGRDWSWQAFVGAPAPRKGLVAMLEGKPVSDDILKLIPATATRLQVGTTDATAALDGMRSLGSTFDPEFAKQLDATIAKINQSLGLDLRKDLLVAFGNEWASYTDPATTGDSMLATVLVNRLSKPAQADSGLTKLEEWINKQIADSMKGQKATIAFVQHKIDGMTLHTLSVPLFAPSWAIKDGVFYAGLYPQVVVAAANGNRSKSILDNESFVALRKRLGGQKAATISFVDLPRTAPGAYQFMLPITQLGLGFADMFGVKAPPLVLPPLNKLLENLCATEDCLWTDAAGFHYRALTPFPGGKFVADNNITVASTAIAVSILLPALNSAKDRANRVRCASNLRQIGQGIMLYANDNKGKFPPDLGTLMTNAALNAEMFICPSANTDLPPNVRGPDKLADAAKWVNANADYVYLAAKMAWNQRDMVNTIIAHDKFDNHETQGINILFGDGHVEWVIMPKAREIIEKQQAK